MRMNPKASFGDRFCSSSKPKKPPPGNTAPQTRSLAHTTSSGFPEIKAAIDADWDSRSKDEELLRRQQSLLDRMEERARRVLLLFVRKRPKEGKRSVLPEKNLRGGS
jgi:hypothetical protein